jgi:hypothetical protein
MAPDQFPLAPVRPITPAEVADLQQELLPPEVLEVFNRCIGETALHGNAIVLQEDVVDALVRRGLERSVIFKKGWLNVEDIYRQAGWEVLYDKPGYNESYAASFTFKAKPTP